MFGQSALGRYAEAATNELNQVSTISLVPHSTSNRLMENQAELNDGTTTAVEKDDVIIDAVTDERWRHRRIEDEMNTNEGATYSPTSASTWQDEVDGDLKIELIEDDGGDNEDLANDNGEVQSRAGRSNADEIIPFTATELGDAFDAVTGVDGDNPTALGNSVSSVTSSSITASSKASTSSTQSFTPPTSLTWRPDAGNILHVVNDRVVFAQSPPR